MLCLYVGENRYLIDHRDIIRILPKVLLKQVPHLPFYLSGFLNLGGKLIPVIDFCQLMEQRETQGFLHSRIVLLKDAQPHSERLLGLLGEKVNEIMDISTEQLNKAEANLTYPYLQTIPSTPQTNKIQLLNIEKLFEYFSTELFKAVE